MATPERSPARRSHLRLFLLAVALAVIAVGAPAHAALTGSASPPASSADARPTVVLVHGAWADGSSWSGVVRRLQDLGYPVRVPPNPLRSLPGDAATLARFLATVPGPVVLAGHSYGGAVITNAAAGNRRVKALVYVDAFAPAQGETVLSLLGPDSALAVDPATVFDAVPYPGAPAGDVDLYLKRAVFLRSFANGVPTRAAAVLYAVQRPITLSASNQPSGVPAWKTIPSWYLVGTQDRIIPPTQQRFMAKRAGSTIVEVGAGHLSLISQPGAVADLIVRAARETR